MNKLLLAMVLLPFPAVCAAQPESADHTVEIQAMEKVSFLVGRWTPAENTENSPTTDLSTRTITAEPDGRALIMSTPDPATGKSRSSRFTYVPSAREYEMTVESSTAEKLVFRAILIAPGTLQIKLPKFQGLLFNVKVIDAMWTETVSRKSTEGESEPLYLMTFKRQDSKTQIDQRKTRTSKIIRGKTFDEWIAQVQHGPILEDRHNALQVLRNDGLRLDGVEEIVFAVRQPGDGGHWYENFGNTAFEPDKLLAGAIGRLCRLNTTTGELRALLDDPDGAVRDPQISYDARTILFAYRPGGTNHYHLYEISADGQQLKQLTDGPYDDIEPTYLPDSRIMFCSSRCRRYVNCWYTRVATLHICDADGSNINPISSNIEHDNTPWPLPDGRVLYTRWEYVDRSRVGFHHLWTMNPDGTNQTVCYGNLHFGTLMIDAKPIPGTDDVVSIFSPGHGKREHDGAVVVLSAKKGPDDQPSARTIHEEPIFRDPYPLDAERFLVASGSKVVLMDAQGTVRDVYRLPKELANSGAECHEPRVLSTRPRERATPPRVDRRASTGRLILRDVYAGRRMEGVEPGEIKRLLVLETLPKPVNFSGKMPPMSYGGTYTLERVLGTVPVAEDGSAYMELPALRPLFFVALDAAGNSVQRMHSFLTVMPGETTSCVGCHEQRAESPGFTPRTSVLAAMSGPPHKIEPLKGIPGVFDFPRDIQPILDRHCVECHDYDRREGGVILTGDRGPIYSHSYFTLTALGYVSDGRDRQMTNLPPRSVGTSASPLMNMLDGAHYEVKLSAHEQDMIRYWIESAAAYPGTYAALGSGMIGGFPYSVLETSDRKWPESIAAADTIQRRCASCHDQSRPLPKYLSDNLEFVLSNPDFSDVRVRNSRHLMFNLTRPEKSLILLAPLAREAGGYGLCRQKTGDGVPTPVFENTDDPDYGKIFALCTAGQSHLERIKRFDMKGFRPNPAYVREMQRFGALPTTLDDQAPIDIYALDEAYWRSFWQRSEADIKAVTAH